MLSGAVIVALTVTMLGHLSQIVEEKESVYKYRPFYEQKEDFDVLFFGSSHVINGIYPMELWEDYGIVSYNFGGHGNTIPTTYWCVKNALDQTHPKLAVIDCLYVSRDFKTSKAYSQVHMSLDSFRFGRNKIAAVNDLLDDEVMNELIENGEVQVQEKREPIGLLWNFSVYHNRWEELQKSDFLKEATVEKGAETRIAVAAPRSVKKLDPTEKLAVGDDIAGVQYLKRIIEECEEAGIDVLLTYLPFAADENAFKESHVVYDIAAEYGVNYIDFLDMDVVNYLTDCYDKSSHLNPSGARKVTDYLGKFIMDNYDVPDQRENPEYEKWEDDYRKYTEFKISHLSNRLVNGIFENYSIDLKAYFTLLYDKHFSCCLYLNDSAVWKAGGAYYEQLRNLGIDPERLPAGSPTLVVLDRMEGMTAYIAPGDSCETAFGTVALGMADGTAQIQIDGSSILTVDPAAVAGAAVIDNATGSVATVSSLSDAGRID